jgi:ADP-ribosyl-[dinitrogen reductase] hydrolase
MMPGPWRHRLIFGRGMLSDDTEHTLFVAQTLLEHPENAEAFQRRFAWRLRWWFASLPPGIGRATARACVKFWLGFSPRRSGVFSAGNGPAMRSALIGGYFFDRPEAIDQFVRASTQITHIDPKAVVGALAVARMAACAVSCDPERRPNLAAIAEALIRLAPADAEWQEWIETMVSALAAGDSASRFATALNLERGVTGYMYHTVPIAVYAWLRQYGDFRATVEAALNCGGDADTVGAIAGALAGATVGESGIPTDWLRGIVDWPRSIRLLRTVADHLDEQRRNGIFDGKVSYFWPAVLPRNLFLLGIVLFHGFRRLAPPY